MLIIALVAVFLCVALVSGLVAQQVAARSAPTARRLRGIAPSGAGVVGDSLPLTETPDPTLSRLSRALPKSPKDLGKLRRRLGTAGYYDLSAAVYFSAARAVLPVVLAAPMFLLLAFADAWPLAMCLAAIGYLLPDLWLRREARRRAKAITNGLPDVLDLMIVCIEAGSALDQSVVKASEELELTHPRPGRGTPVHHHRDSCRQAPHGGVSELRRADPGGRRAHAGHHADPDRPLRHQRREGAPHSRRHVAHQAAAARGGTCGQDRRQARVPSGVLCLSCGLHGVHRPGGYCDLPGILQKAPRNGEKVEA